MEEKRNFKSIYHKDIVPLFKVIGKVLLGLVCFILGLLLIVYIALQIQPVQQFAADKATGWLSEKLETQVSIGRVKIDFFKKIVLEDIYVEDQQQDTLLYAGALKVDIGLFALMRQTINVNSIELDRAYVNLMRRKGQEKFNWEFIPEAFASEDTVAADTSESAWNFDLEALQFTDTRFYFFDYPENTFLEYSLAELTADINTLGLEDNHPQIELLRFRDMNVAFRHDKVLEVNGDTISVDGEPTPLEDFGFYLTLNRLEILESQVSYTAQNMPRVERGIDYNYLDIAKLSFVVKDVVIQEKTLQADIARFGFIDQSGFELKNLALQARMELPTLNLTLQELQTPQSSFFEEVRIRLDDINRTDDILNGLAMQASFRRDSIAIEEVRFFTDALDTMPALHGQKIYLSGDLNLQNAEANWQNMDLRINDQNYLSGKVLLRNLDDPDNLYFDVKLSDAQAHTQFVDNFLPPGTLAPEFRTIGTIRLQATARGTTQNLTARANVRSAAGNIDANGTVREGAGGSMIFDASMNGTSIALNRFLGEESQLGSLTMQANARGIYGENILRIDTAVVLVNSLVYNQYEYNNLEARASYINEIANLDVDINDQHLKSRMWAIANMQTNRPIVLFNAVVEEANLYALNLTEDTLSFRTSLKADFHGSSADDMAARVKFDFLTLEKDGNVVEVDTLSLVALAEGQSKQYRVLSPFLQAYVWGNFTIEELPQAIDLFVKNYFSNYAENPAPLTSPQNLAFNISLQSNPTLLQAFVPDLQIPRPIVLKGHFSSENNYLDIEADAPRIIYADNIISGFRLRVDTEQDTLQFFTNLDELHSGDNLVVAAVNLDGNLIQDGLDFRLRLMEETAPSRLRINGLLSMNGDTIGLGLSDAQIFVESQQWVLADDASIVYAPEYLSVNNFALQQGEQRIAVNTSPIAGGKVRLLAELSRISVGSLYALIGDDGVNLDGELNGTVEVADLFDPQTIAGDIRIGAFRVNESLIGDIFLQANKPATSSLVSMKAGIQSQYNDVRATGQYNIEDEAGALSFDVVVQQLMLDQFQPLLKDQLTQLSGNLFADIRIRGTAQKPDIRGEIVMRGQNVIEPAMTRVPITITDQRIAFTGSQMRFNRFTIIDDRRRAAVLEGTVDYSDFSAIRQNLKLTADNFHILDNTRSDFKTLYGTLIVGSNLTITGTTASPVVGGSIRIVDGSNITLEISDEVSDISTPDFITLYDGSNPQAFQQEEAARDSLSNAGITGVTMNTRVSITRATNVTVIVDPKNGDNLKITGDADLALRMDPRGDLNMVGTYTINSGAYEMSVFGAIQRRLELQQGSTINWYGSPLDATFDLTAVYVANTATYDLIADRIEMLPENEVNLTRRRIPVNVLLSMEGELFNPQLSFDLKAPEELDGQAGEIFRMRLGEIRQDETELNKQVFALIAFNRFINTPGSSTTGNAGGQAVSRQIDQSVSQFMNQQLNNISEDYLRGMEINVDLRSRTQADGSYGTGFDDRQLNVSLSQQLFSERVKVTVGSTLDMGPSAQAGTQPDPGGGARNIIGDFIVEYRINQSGNLNLKFFRRDNRNAEIITVDQNERIGLSIAHRKNFDRFRELIGRVPPQFPPQEDEDEIQVDPMEDGK
jgi:hypothetical protein